jgi:hypothetical protein
VEALRLLRHVPAITELMLLDPSGREQLKVSCLAMDVVAPEGGEKRRAVTPAGQARR